MQIKKSTQNGVFTVFGMVNLVTTSGTPAEAEMESAWAVFRFFLTEKSSIATILVLYYSWFKP